MFLTYERDKPIVESLLHDGSFQNTRPAIFSEESPSPEPIIISAGSSMSQHVTVRKPLTEHPSRKRGCVVVDLASDDVDVLPAPVPFKTVRPPAPQAAIPASVASVSVPPALDSREGIAAARLKHFEKKVHDTIDLTLDD
jgi:hypothetical protein